MHARWSGARARQTPHQERCAEQEEPSFDPSKIPLPSSVSPATHQAQVSRHVTFPDVAPSLPGRVTHHRVTLPPPKGQQDAIGRTSVFVPSGQLRKRRLGSASPPSSDRKTQWILQSRLSVRLSSSGLGWDVPRRPRTSGPELVNEIARDALHRSPEIHRCREPSSHAILRSP